MLIDSPEYSPNGSRTGPAATVSRMHSAMARASGASVSGAMTTNSSPP